MKFLAILMGVVGVGGLSLVPFSAAAEVGAATDNTYPPEAVAAFMADCQPKFAAQAPPGFSDRGDRYCTCVINQLQETMPYAQFRQLGPEEEPPELKAATHNCIGSIF